MMRRPAGLVLALLLAGCGSGATEVMRLRSPDGKIDAVMLETVRGDTADYAVRAVPVDPADGQPGPLLTVADVPHGIVCPRAYAMRWGATPGPNGTAVRQVEVTVYSGRPQLASSPPQFRSGMVLAQFGGPMPGGIERCPDAPAPKAKG